MCLRTLAKNAERDKNYKLTRNEVCRFKLASHRSISEAQEFERIVSLSQDVTVQFGYLLKRYYTKSTLL